MTLASIDDRLGSFGMAALGAFHPARGDTLPSDIQTLVMIGPTTGFWAVFKQSDEYRDGIADPMDRWSRRVIGTLACDLGGKAYFPFGGPPFQPFIAWAQRTGRTWQSPVGLLVHDTSGLFVSYRGALGLRDRLEIGQTNSRPCDSCDQPCLSACPIGALSADGYDVPNCKSYITGTDDCLSAGCKVRRACPVSQKFDRSMAQSAFHMKAFVG
ncbi:ferredoxin [Nereida sp. MMG025]|uniref:ferredoxin n=1 Tax=Nereida sp. MMG025 TaxID=2909981 RepID=UPI001F313AFA|nr:ferredoxin [Nereida sp. MMG025]MCF6444260.1 ferredoxin [Nereida sp. MMG025]